MLTSSAEKTLRIITQEYPGIFFKQLHADFKELIHIHQHQFASAQSNAFDLQSGFECRLKKFTVFRIFPVKITISGQMFADHDTFSHAVCFFYRAYRTIQIRQIQNVLHIVQEGRRIQSAAEVQHFALVMNSFGEGTG